ncbi:MAG: Asp-tRNA(Asn)/Glu-tRNA(Gln) amidotransferase GatCAB subunit C, partial [Candidatus Hydrogenedentota bacterium]
MLEELFPRRVPCGNFTKENVTSDKIVVSGWVYHYRDQGGVIFIDLRDRSGILQLVFDKSTNEKLHAEADTLRSEDVILVEGVLRQRDKDSINPKMPTGEVELVAEKLFVLSKCNHLPMPVDEYERPGEDTRLKYRFLDLRRREMQEALQARHQFIHAVRM